MKLTEVNEDNFNDVEDFLRNVATINDINKSIVENAVIIKDEDEIIGILSFEEFGQLGLIRYFIFKKAVKEDIVIELLEEVSKKAKSKGIKCFITLVMKDEIVNIFRSLGFVSIKSRDIFLDEENILDSKFKDCYVLKYEI